MTIRCLIVDDEPVAHTILQNYLSGVPEIEVAGHFYNSLDARNFMEGNVVDLLFLDIMMPGEDGLSLLKTLNKKPVTILTTALIDHALEAYDLDVIDYLVKPIRPERFQKAVDKAIEFLRPRRDEYIMSGERIPGNSYINIKSGREQLQIDTATISHIQALKDYMLIYTPAKKHIVRSTILKMLEMLPADLFARVHKSFIINRSFVKRIASSKVEIEGYTIPLGKSFRQSLLE